MLSLCFCCCCHCSIIYLVGLVRSYRMCVMQTHIREYEMRDKQLGTYRERERIVVKWCTNQAAEDCTNERTENGWWTCVCVCVCCWKIRSLLPEQILNESACVSARVCVAESLLQARCYYFTLVVLAKGKLCKGNEQKKMYGERSNDRGSEQTNTVKTAYNASHYTSCLSTRTIPTNWLVCSLPRFASFVECMDWFFSCYVTLHSGDCTHTYASSAHTQRPCWQMMHQCLCIWNEILWRLKAQRTVCSTTMDFVRK